ncbi:MAG TPA: hypothetical protein VG537_03530 [Candidatus Kapabacteria bacterium]|jgi:hypothetical protein|nr:hypothetical protein [Candidatus Kapabacteria bacterium]
MKILSILSLLIILLAGCGGDKSQGKPDTTAVASKPPSPASGTNSTPDYSYQITGEYNKGLNPRWVGVELSKKITKDELTSLATSLHVNYKDFAIGFRLKGMNSGDLPWAIALFEPDLKITINGSTEDEQNKAALAAKQNIDGKVIGKWHEDFYPSSTYVIFEKGGKTYERRIFEQGITNPGSSAPSSKDDAELIKRKVHGLTRFYEKDGHPEDYFIISKDSNMEFYDDEGYINTAAKTQ